MSPPTRRARREGRLPPQRVETVLAGWLAGWGHSMDHGRGRQGCLPSLATVSIPQLRPLARPSAITSSQCVTPTTRTNTTRKSTCQAPEGAKKGTKAARKRRHEQRHFQDQPCGPLP
ncbi:hypothetical protein GQ607_014894 [Colletotrichum asianum]|uniref:Uncharacterized protein n=1 Tax=Colletotrichum asianum TaxID=702518 RepID=A0A8H3W1P2_9PEZI|nr:hypothetical protein GQ607_014894 [Colletotrichum asianum]